MRCARLRVFPDRASGSTPQRVDVWCYRGLCAANPDVDPPAYGQSPKDRQEQWQRTVARLGRLHPSLARAAAAVGPPLRSFCSCDHNAEPHAQDVFFCLTCDPHRKEGVCRNCARVCHGSHKLAVVQVSARRRRQRCDAMRCDGVMARGCGEATRRHNDTMGAITSPTVALICANSARHICLAPLLLFPVLRSCACPSPQHRRHVCQCDQLHKSPAFACAMKGGMEEKASGTHRRTRTRTHARCQGNSGGTDREGGGMVERRGWGCGCRSVPVPTCSLLCTL